MNGTYHVLVYANGVNLIGNDTRTIERNTDVLINACKDIGLAINIGKTTVVSGYRVRLEIQGSRVQTRLRSMGFLGT